MSLRDLLQAAAGELSLSSALGRFLNSLIEQEEISEKGSGQIMIFGGPALVAGEASYLYPGNAQTALVITHSQDDVVMFDGTIVRIVGKNNDPQVGSPAAMTWKVFKGYGATDTGISQSWDTDDTLIHGTDVNYPVSKDDTLSVKLSAVASGNTACKPFVSLLIRPR